MMIIKEVQYSNNFWYLSSVSVTTSTIAIRIVE